MKYIAELNKKWANRNPNMDLVRVVATLSLISLHFFAYTNFYKETIQEGDTYIACMIGARIFFMQCVPLFVILSGYLLGKKELTPSYYKGIIYTVGIYVIVSIICVMYRIQINKQELTFTTALKTILNYSAAEYSWYIEMYFGLFALIPFLNLIYRNLQTKRQKQALLLTMLVLCTLPGMCNVYANGTKVVPAWWVSLWPLLYYFIGCYIREYSIKLSWVWNVVLLAAALIACTAFSYTRSVGKLFEWGAYNEWGGWHNVLLSVLTFTLLSNLKLQKIPDLLKGLLFGISKLSLGIYLSSWILDDYVYKRLTAELTNFREQSGRFGITVIKIFFGALLVSLVANVVYAILSKCVQKIWAVCRRKKQ